jgi:hypothetical protein
VEDLMDERNLPDFAGEEDDDSEVYSQLEELEKLETIIALMEELGIETLAEARTRFDTLERSIDADA